MIADWLTGLGLGWLVAGLPWVGATVLAQANLTTVRDTWRGTSGNSPVTWSIWAVLSAIALWAQLSIGGWTAAAVLLVPVTGVCVGVAAGALYRYRDAEPGVWWQYRVDRVCAAGSTLALITMLLVADRPAIVLTVVTDAIAAVPAATMAWWPSRDRPVPYTPFVSVAVAAVCTIAAAPADAWQVLYPAYLIGLGLAMVAIIRYGRAALPAAAADLADVVAVDDPLRWPPTGLRPPPTWPDEPSGAAPLPLVDDRGPSPAYRRPAHSERTATVSTRRHPPRWSEYPAPAALARFAPTRVSEERLVALLSQVHREAWRCGWHDRDRLPSSTP